MGAAEQSKAGRFPLFVVAVIVLGAIALTLTLFKDLSSVLAPAFLAVNLVVTTYPAYRWLEKHRVPRILAALIIGVLLFSVLVLVTVSLVWAGNYMVASLTE